MLLLGCGTPMICCASDFYHSPSLLSLPLARLTGLPVSRLLQPSWCVPEPFSPPRDGGGGLKADHQRSFFSPFAWHTTNKSTARPDKVRCGLTPWRPNHNNARSLPTSCQLYWERAARIKKRDGAAVPWALAALGGRGRVALGEPWSRSRRNGRLPHGTPGLAPAPPPPFEREPLTLVPLSCRADCSTFPRTSKGHRVLRHNVWPNFQPVGGEVHRQAQ